MGAAESSQLTTRPSLERAMRPAFSSTARCFMKPGSDMRCSTASSVTPRSPSERDCIIQHAGDEAKGGVFAAEFSDVDR